MYKLRCKGKGEHSVGQLELIIEQQAEELHLLKSEQLVCIDCKSYKICSKQHDTKQTCSLFNPAK